MPAIKVKNGRSNIKITAKPYDFESINQRELNIISSLAVPCLVVPKKCTEHKITYVIPEGCISLRDYLSNGLLWKNKELVFAQLKDLIKKAELNTLNLNNLILNYNDVYVNLQTSTVSAIYLPIENKNDTSTFRFIVSDIINNHQTEKVSLLYGDYHYLSEVANADENLAPCQIAVPTTVNPIDGVNPVNYANSDNYGETTVLNNGEYNYSSVTNTAPSQTDYQANQNSFGMTEPLDNQSFDTDFNNYEIGVTEPLDESLDSVQPFDVGVGEINQNNFADNIFVNDNAVGNINDNNSYEQNFIGVTEPLDDINDIDINNDNYYNSGNTVLLDMVEPEANAKIIVQSTGAEYVINKEQFNIGSDPSVCDCTLASGFVSKCQVTIMKEFGEYFAVDNGSTNGTTHNSNKMMPGMRYQLNNEDRLILANEIIDFVL